MPDIVTVPKMSRCEVFVNGTFDLLHTGHLNLLYYAKSYAGPDGRLTVAIDSDERVKQLKGNNRPVVSEEDRKFHLLSLRYVDSVVIFNTDDDLSTIIKLIKPDVMIKGSDYVGKPIIGEEFCKHIIFFNRLNEYSTSKTIESCSNRG